MQLDKIRGSEEIIEEQHQADLQVMVVQQAEIKKLKEQKEEMLTAIKTGLNLATELDYRFAISMFRNLIEKIEGGK